jgi:hypothetical protein
LRRNQGLEAAFIMQEIMYQTAGGGNLAVPLRQI